VRFVRRFARSAAILAALTLVPLARAPVPAAGQPGGRPNVLVILTDDHRGTETLEWMPKTLQWFGQGGTNFTTAYATTPLCCPARAALMTGRFNHNNAVLDNGDQANLDHTSTIQRYLVQAGYRTGISGKFLNGWPIADDPPHFERWAIMQPSSGLPGEEGYYGTTFNVDGTVQTVGKNSTDYIAERAIEYVQDWEGDDADPWFLYLAPYASHSPWVAEGGHPVTDDDDYTQADVGTWAGNPAVFEADESDKPEYVKNADSTFDQALVKRQGQLRSLLTVDDLVGDVFDELDSLGEQDTLAVFLGDNGFFWSEHGLNGKNAPYTESIRIPLLLRWPGHVAPTATDARPASNVDITPTIMGATGITPDAAYPLDGRSLLDLGARTKMLTESWPAGSRGPWASVRTAAYQFVEYYDDTSGAVDFREYYDLTVDPWQLTNLYGDGNQRNDPWAGALGLEVGGLRTCVGQACSDLLDQPGIPLKCPGNAQRPGHHLVGSEVGDSIGGFAWRNVMCGRDGKDNVRAKAGRDRLIGGQGRDTLVAGPGRDFLDGGPGRDVCRGGPGKDRFKACEVETG